MVQSEKFGDPARPFHPNAAEVDGAVDFRFQVTWTCLYAPRDVSKPLSALAPSERLRSRSLPPTQATPPADTPTYADVVAPDSKRIRSTPGFQWEMVVPKMVRSTKRPSQTAGVAAPAPRQLPPLPLAASETSLAVESAPGTISEARELQSGPNLYTASASSWKVIAINLLVAIGVIALAVTLWRHRTSPKEIETVMGGTGWMRNVAERRDPGARQSRQIVLYRPSINTRDGRLEFTWGVAPTGVAWVFRAKDLGNYYAMRLKVVKPGPSPTMSLEHFTVYHWVEGPRTEKILVLSRNDPAMRVRMDVFGPTFTVYLQGSASDYWNDGRLTTGGFGFLEDWYQGADIRSVRMSFQERSSVQPHLALPNLQEYFAMHFISPGILPASGGN